MSDKDTNETYENQTITSTPNTDAENTSEPNIETQVINNRTQPIEKINSADVIIQRHSTGPIYALGTVEILFPNKGIKKQFLSVAQILGVNEQDYYAVFTNNNATTDRDKYLYLAEQVQWVLSINAHPSYVLISSAKSILSALIASVKPPSDTLEPVYTCVIGTSHIGENSLSLPEIICQQSYSHTMSQLHSTIKDISCAQTKAIQDVIKELELQPNRGASHFDRARNFVAFRYPDIYAHTHKMQTGSDNIDSASLLRIEMKNFDSVSSHSIVDMTFVYQENSADKRHYFYCRVDVTGLYPFINTAIQAFTPVQLLV
ncbi:hypothetical protein [Pseudoalteromonas sp.]|uniref:cyanobactin maturation protease PatG family protein n=1 Tax=Pseudoalteromonas sp. TaxID=53249 RepID=UPI0023562B20|nr:hypothetical protein [Pseudoalteromonas sp.]